MTPPVRDPFAGKSGGTGVGGKDFTPNLGPIDSQAPVSSSAWDSETGTYPYFIRVACRLFCFSPSTFAPLFLPSDGSRRNR
jgi:hypothetical protein